MAPQQKSQITDIVGKIPYRLALAGGWIDQPYVSKFDPSPPGSMVTVQVEPQFRFMDRSGICGSTRRIALDIWNGTVPSHRDKMELVRGLYEEENKDVKDPSGSQDMIGLVYPGVNRLDYNYKHEGGYFPVHIESNNDPIVAQWLSDNLYFVPVNQRPDGYYPLDNPNYTAELVDELGKTGKDCYDAIVRMDIHNLGKSFNDCMRVWGEMLPGVVKHNTIKFDLMGLLDVYQQNYAGAMFSGCGGGYFYVISEESVPGGFQVMVRVENE